MRLRSRDLFQTVRAESGLLPADLLQRIADNDARLGGLAPADYHLASGERLNEAVTRSWNRMLGAWRGFDAARAQLPPGDRGGRLTRERWLHVLFDELGYGRLVQQPAIEIEDRSYPVFTQWQHTPIHLVGCGVKIDTRTAGVAGAAGQSPHSLLQEVLNRSPDRLWGIVSNGLVLRILRDNVALTRQAYVEFDLEAMFTGEVYADFVLLWLVAHQSRVEADRPEDCWLERWTADATELGTRALEALRKGVEDAIAILGTGFLAHPANGALHAALRDGTLDRQEYYRRLLRLVYRLLFLFVAEDRDALLDPRADAVVRARYVDHYSTQRLRALAHRRRGGRQHDRYEQLKFVMRALHGDGCPPLGLPALGSFLWSPEAIGELGESALANEHLLDAIRALASVDDAGVRRTVDFRNLGAEELGSVYESLLELVPELHRESATFTLGVAAGSERKTTGSYYTPTSLITSLLDTALEPVLDEAAASGEEGLLSVTVCDPACGSGHFLIAAANRIAKRVAALRTGDAEPAPAALRAALRDVIGRCVYGVDVNPMAVELCKVSLWMEAVDPGRPLSFLDHRIVLGNSLLGTTPALIAAGIPDEAFKPLLGDDKKVTTELRKRNAAERKGQLEMLPRDPLETARSLGELAEWVDAVGDATLDEVHEREERHRALLESDERERARLVADTWCTAFVQAKRRGEPAITQRTLDSVARGEAIHLRGVPERMRFFHWHLAFPALFPVDGEGGFDCVLGNPPWDRVKLQEKEFFASRHPEIAGAANKAARERLIKGLEETDSILLVEWEAAQRDAEGASHFIRSSGRYPLCGRGDVNTYAVFAETNRSVIGPRGRVGCIVPTGIATDDTTKLFFQDLVERQSLVSLFDFENRENLFPGVGHGRMKFCLLTLAAQPVPSAEFVFFALRAEHLNDPERRFTLSAADIGLLNPNTRTCPIFRSARDAELTKAIYRMVPVLVRQGDPESNPWDVSFAAMLHMANDSGLFRTADELMPDGWTPDGSTIMRDGWRKLPLYEAKMVHHFDHRYGDYADRAAGSLDSQLPDVPPERLDDPTYSPCARYWVDESEVSSRLAGRWSRGWLLGWRDICRAADERTVIATVLPRTAVGHKFLLILSPQPSTMLAALDAVLSSFVFDYVARQKHGGASLAYFTMRQLPVPTPAILGRPASFDASISLTDWLVPRVLELAFTAYDLTPFARDLGYHGEPFRWDVERRSLLRAELDAAFFHVYGIERDDVDYILDTFPIVRRKDEKSYGEYRTKRTILEVYDAMACGTYETPLDPPPGDPRAAHRPVSVEA
jgi:hypothetical protein